MIEIEPLKKEIDRSLESLGIRLKAARVARGFSSGASFAETCGISLQTYFGHESGRYNFGVFYIMLYSRTLNVSVNWLMWGDGHPLEHLDTVTSESDMFMARMKQLIDSRKSEVNALESEKFETST